MVFLADLLDSTLQIFSLKNKIHKIWLKITGSAHSQTTNKLVNKAANDSSRVSGQDREKQPALGINQIAGFGGFRPLASSELLFTEAEVASGFYRGRVSHLAI